MNRRASITSILSPNYDPAFARLADSGVFTSFLPVKLKQQLIRNQVYPLSQGCYPPAPSPRVPSTLAIA